MTMPASEIRPGDILSGENGVVYTVVVVRTDHTATIASVRYAADGGVSFRQWSPPSTETPLVHPGD